MRGSQDYLTHQSDTISFQV